MKIEEYLKYTRHIESTFPLGLLERKIMQVTDLRFFMEYFSEDITVIDCINYKLSVIQTKGKMNGIFTYDLASENSFPSVEELQQCKDYFQIESLWFVIVQEKKCRQMKSDEQINFYDIFEIIPQTAKPKRKRNRSNIRHQIIKHFDNVFILQLWKPNLVKVYNFH